VISKEEHLAYFENVWSDSTKRYFICEIQDGSPVGVVNFVNIDVKNKSAFWAFYSGNLYVIIGGDDATNLTLSKVFLLSQGGAGKLGMAAGDQDHGPGVDGGDRPARQFPRQYPTP